MSHLTISLSKRARILAVLTKDDEVDAQGLCERFGIKMKHALALIREVRGGLKRSPGRPRAVLLAEVRP